MSLTALFLLTACNGDGDPDTDDTDDTDVPPPSFDFVDSVRAQSFEATVAPEAIDAHRVASMLLASTAVVVADEKVQDRLNTDGGGTPGLRGAYSACWSRPAYPMFSFTLDYTGCQGYQMGGGVFILDHPSGPLLFGFQDFAIGDRTIAGSLAFDTRGAYPQSMFWQTYNTDGRNPGLDNPVPIGVDLGSTTYGVSWLGGASVDFAGDRWSMWGTLVTGPIEAPLTVVLGGTEPEDVAPDAWPGPTAMRSSLNWMACRCPTSGQSAYDMPLEFSEVTVDLDDLEVEPDDIDDPAMVIPLDYELTGRALLTNTGCGEYDVVYESDDASIPLEKDRLVGAVSFLCDTLTISDRVRCNAFVAAAEELPDGIEILVKKADANATATAAVENDFDTTWCRLY